MYSFPKKKFGGRVVATNFDGALLASMNDTGRAVKMLLAPTVGLLEKSTGLVGSSHCAKRRCKCVFRMTALRGTFPRPSPR